jgi:hypothetical protein
MVLDPLTNQEDMRCVQVDHFNCGGFGMIETRHGSFQQWMIIEDDEGNLELVLFDEVVR